MSNALISHTQGNSLGNHMEKYSDSISGVLKEIPGNDKCAECSAPEPEWASLNLGILMCIECSGAHRNLGVHISKVRSITLDVKVWEPTILELFKALGISYCNSVWEELLSPDKDRLSGNCLRGCSLLHLACHVGNAIMIELLLQSGADVNMRDFHGRAPLHHCITKKNNELAKYIQANVDTALRCSVPQIDDFAQGLHIQKPVL